MRRQLEEAVLQAYQNALGNQRHPPGGKLPVLPAREKNF